MGEFKSLRISTVDVAEVKYIGLEELELDVMVQKQVESTVEKHVEIIERELNNQLEVKVHVKAYSQTGEKHKYSVNIQVNYPGGSFVSDKANDWDLLTSIKQGFKAIEHQIEHKFHS